MQVRVSHPGVANADSQLVGHHPSSLAMCTDLGGPTSPYVRSITIVPLDAGIGGRAHILIMSSTFATSGSYLQGELAHSSPSPEHCLMICSVSSEGAHERWRWVERYTIITKAGSAYLHVAEPVCTS